jgi:3-hydroxybenzoate 6-monooxygenase
VRTARVQLGSRSMWEFYHAAGIARDVRNAKCLARSEDQFCDCLAWLWDGVPVPTDLQGSATDRVLSA